MTPDDLRALADALERMAQLERYGSPGALALESATAYLRAQADAQPVAWVDVADSYEGPYIFSGKELLPAGRHDLYTHPAPAAPQAEPETFESELRSFAQTPEQAEFVEKVLAAEPKREPLSDEQIDAALQSDPAMGLALMSGEMTVGEFKAALRRLARTVERAHGISGGGHD